MMPGFTIWLTGLPSSGKSTLAALVAAALGARGFPAAILDGDEVRTWLTAGLGFARVDRDENIRRIAHLAAFQNRIGAVAITAAISPYRAARDEARRVIGRFVEVHVDCPLEVCEERDVKGLYRKARRGEVQAFTGVSDPYEAPVSPEVVVRTASEDRERCAARIVERAEDLGYLPRGHVRCEAVVPADLVAALGPDGVTALAAFESRRGGRAVEGLPRITAAEWEKIAGRLRELGYLE